MIKRHLGVIAALLSPMLGRFGMSPAEQHDLELYQRFDDGHSKPRLGSRLRVGTKPRRKNNIHPDFYGHWALNSSRVYDALIGRSRHGKCSNWIRENRRRRSCGMPQLRASKGAN